jgi:hypothetical protein
MDIVDEFREVAKLRREAQVSLAWESEVRATLICLSTKLTRFGHEIGVVI